LRRSCLVAALAVLLAVAPGCSGASLERTAARLAPLSPERIRSVTYVVEEPIPNYLAELQDAVPAIKKAGFNTVWLVLPWWRIQPRPLADPPVWDEGAVESVRVALDYLARHRMHALIGLDYLGQGWSPQGIDPCGWATNLWMEGAFERYVSGFLRRIEAYNDVADILIFTETAAPCRNPYENAPRFARQLRLTLGSLPERLPRKLRRLFRIGFHDDALINLNWAKGVSPLPRPQPFDFLSLTAYGFERDSAREIDRELTARVRRFRRIAPRTPLVIGELGASRCETHGEADQARVASALVSYALRHGLGFNVWHWQPVPREDTCRVDTFRALSITDADGRLNEAGRAIARLLRHR
jgi:hypothetical protein